MTHIGKVQSKTRGTRYKATIRKTGMESLYGNSNIIIKSISKACNTGAGSRKWARNKKVCKMSLKMLVLLLTMVVPAFSWGAISDATGQYETL
jgi:hypothetical protein